MKNKKVEVKHTSATIFLLLLIQVFAFIVYVVISNASVNSGTAWDNDVYTHKYEVDKVLLIQRDNSRNNRKARLHLSSFVHALKTFPKIEGTMIEGVGDNVKLLGSIIDDYYKKGYKQIFINGFKYDIEFSNIFRKYPDVVFFLYGGSAKEWNVINFSPRTYAMKYLLGLIAGASTKNDKIGYVADLRNNWNLRSINAFAIGVSKVNPKAKIYVAWTNNNSDIGAAKFLANQLIENEQVDLITGSLESCIWCEVASQKTNLKFIGQMVDEHEKFDSRYLATYMYDMESIYSYFFVTIANGQRVTRDNYWFGNRQGAVRIGYVSDKIPDDILSTLEKERQMMRENVDFVFRGPVYSNEGRLVVPDNSVISDRELEKSFDWLNFNIVEYPLDGNYYREHITNYKADDESLNDIDMEILDLKTALSILGEQEPKAEGALQKNK